ncbi:MAG TPA: TatD family hydrolase, partial [Propionibacteriaceae bacterium]|nr:TatD family hydrolase [Propionibacteriaceae bacterium]
MDLPERPAPLPAPVVDTHCHLDVTERHSGLDAGTALAWAAEVGVTRVVQVGCDVEGSRWAVAAAERWPNVVAGVAIHPNDAARLGAGLPAALGVVEGLAGHPRVRAVGETGLDY